MKAKTENACLQLINAGDAESVTIDLGGSR